MTSAVVIVNASSGAGCPEGYDRELEARFAERGVNARVLLVANGEEIVHAAHEAVQAGAQCVVAAGGDGTVSAVASQLAGSSVAMGVLPMGTLNHFAKDCGIGTDVDEAMDVIAAGRIEAVDVGEVNVLDREHQRRRLGRGKWLALMSACVHAARRYPVLSVLLDVDGQPLVRRSAFVFIGNNEYKMEGFEIGERSRLDAGQLCLYVTQRTGRFGLLRLAVRALFRRIEQARDFDVIRAMQVKIETRRRFLHVATDGEVTVMQTPLQYRIRAGALRVMLPRL
jgi:diacylglycerol kinase family enzyme